MTKSQWWWIQYRRLIAAFLIVWWLGFSISVIAQMNTSPWWRVPIVGVLLMLFGLVLTFVWDLVRMKTRDKI